MAQIKILKINSSGFPEEHGSSDDLTMATLTGATSVGVTSGVTLTNNITFNAVTDTIAGIQNQNLLDKTANETITGDYVIATGHSLTITDAPVNDTDAVNKAYVDGVAQGIHWQEPVLDIQVDATLDPGATPTTGDRYIITDSGNLHANFNTISGLGDNDIVEYNGSAFVVAWDASVEGEGGAAWVEDVNKVYIFNGTAWVTMSSVYDHNNLSGLQGGTTGEYYHMTATEDTWLAAALVAVPNGSNLVDATGNETISGDWTFTGAVDISGGEFTFPNAVSASPAEGDAYWDGTTDTLYVYNGTAWQDVSSSGSANSVQSVYTAGEAIGAVDAVYISASDTVMKANASASSTARVIGFAPSAILNAAQGYVQEDGVLAGFTGLTAGAVYFLSTTAGTISTTPPTGSGHNVVKVGIAKSSTELHIQIQTMGVRA